MNGEARAAGAGPGAWRGAGRGVWREVSTLATRIARFPDGSGRTACRPMNGEARAAGAGPGAWRGAGRGVWREVSTLATRIARFPDGRQRGPVPGGRFSPWLPASPVFLTAAGRRRAFLPAGTHPRGRWREFSARGPPGGRFPPQGPSSPASPVFLTAAGRRRAFLPAGTHPRGRWREFSARGPPGGRFPPQGPSSARIPDGRPHGPAPGGRFPAGPGTQRGFLTAATAATLECQPFLVFSSRFPLLRIC